MFTAQFLQGAMQGRCPVLPKTHLDIASNLSLAACFADVDVVVFLLHTVLITASNMCHVCIPNNGMVWPANIRSLPGVLKT